ncbi:MAG: hypothetical protein H6625_00130 [Bdellovibrionaceae bacterium]|nr:hypothetical protein [Pseudobdellovibrionaceae bacterium]
MRKSQIILSLIAVAFLGGCAMKTKILDASAVSMKHHYLPEKAKMKSIGEVTGEFCTDSSQEGQIGLMDEAIKDAQAKSKADFITNVTFYSTGQCVTLEGTGHTLVKK